MTSKREFLNMTITRLQNRFCINLAATLMATLYNFFKRTFVSCTKYI